MRYYPSRWLKRPKFWTKYVNYLGFEDGKYACKNCDHDTDPLSLSIEHFCDTCFRERIAKWFDWRFSGNSQKPSKKTGR